MGEMNMDDYYAMQASRALEALKSDTQGLSGQEATKRLARYGANELPRDKRFTGLIIFFNQLRDPLILLLIFAGLLSLFLHELIESVAIFSIVILNALLGFYQEYKAEKAIESLKKLSAPTARTLRDGKEQRIPAKELVPGDIILLEAGDIVPADSRLFDIHSLQIDEASLTGESVPSKKVTEPLTAGTPVADQENMAFQGTIVTHGKGKSVVTSTGVHTEFGKVASALKETKESETPLQIKFARLAKQIGAICVVLVIVVMITGLLREMPLAKLILFSLALTVSTIPNSLPLVVTVGLSRGTKELAARNMLVKKLPAAEGLGSATCICSDKTGTITKNQMTVTDIYQDGEVTTVSGSGYKPQGNFFRGTRQMNPKGMELLFRIGYLCNNAKLLQQEGQYSIIGDPTEGSLVVLAKKAGLQDDELKNDFSLTEEFPFDSERKRMSVICKNKAENRTVSYVKGAPDLLLQCCERILEHGQIRKLTAKDRERILKANNSFAEKALRVLCLAYKDLPKKEKYGVHDAESRLVFVGLVGMIDPPRDEVKGAIERCTRAGIRVMIITGDHALTAKAVARSIGLFESNDLVMTGEEIERMSDRQLESIIGRIRIIARAMPVQKLRVVEALQKNGHIVAMTGDGVNDAPALKKANIGIAMGITGTDVTKEVAEAILTDDNFASIVNAIEAGRNIYDKLIKSAKFFLSCNFGEIISVLTAILMGFPLPLLPLQILLMNMLTDNFPALGLGFESSEKGIMERSPRNPKETPLTRTTMLLILLFGVIMGIGTLLMFMNYKDIDLPRAQTVAFTTLVMFQMFAVMSSRTLYPSLKHLNPFSNMWLLGAVCLSILIQLGVIYWPPLQAIFGTVPLSLTDWAKILGISSLGFVLMEMSKVMMKGGVLKMIGGLHGKQHASCY
jgi:Ca2+-transporting ATPase